MRAARSDAGAQVELADYLGKQPVVLGISIDSPGVARRTVTQLGLQFPLLSDPRMRVIRQYGMKGKDMQMADMGYVIIDRQGRMRARQIDPQFGAHSRDLLAIVQRLRTA